MRRVTAVILVAVLAAMSGCGISLSGVLESSPVWSADGNIYFFRDTFDGPTTFWMRTPSGSVHQVDLGVPSEVQADPTCTANDIDQLGSFIWPSGALGISYVCEGSSYFYSYTASSNTLTYVTRLAGVGLVAWLDEGSNGYSYPSASCFGFARVIDGRPQPFPAPLTIGGQIDDLGPVGHAGPCNSTGIGTSAVATATGRYWGFLFAEHAQSRSAAIEDNTTAMRLYIWADGSPQPQPVGSAIRGAIDLVLNARRGIVAIACGGVGGTESIVFMDVHTGHVVKTIRDASYPAFSPDGDRFVYVIDDHIAISKL
jgi:hypothetical protein